MSEISERVVAIIAEQLGKKESEITPEANLQLDLGADSLSTVEITMLIEKEFGISIPEDKADTFQTVGDVLNFVEAEAAKA